MPTRSAAGGVPRYDRTAAAILDAAAHALSAHGSSTNMAEKIHNPPKTNKRRLTRLPTLATVKAPSTKKRVPFFEKFLNLPGDPEAFADAAPRCPVFCLDCLL